MRQFSLRKNHRKTPSALGGAEGSGRLLLTTETPPVPLVAPVARYTVSRLNGTRGPGTDNSTVESDLNPLDHVAKSKILSTL